VSTPFFAHGNRPIGQQIVSARAESRVASASSLSAAFAATPPATARVAAGELQGQIADSVDDVSRIVSLPFLHQPTEAEYLALCQSLMTEEAWRDGEKLNIYQVMGALAWKYCPGVFGPMAVGTGKTLFLQLLVSLARRDGHTKIVLLLPRDSIDQLLDYDLKWIMYMIPWNVEGPHSFKNLGPKKRLLLAQAAAQGIRRGLFLLPYSLLSSHDEDTPDLLQEIKPTVILADECYFLKNVDTSACARRVVRYLKQYPTTRFVAVAGSITSKGPDDYAHLLEAALHEGSPLPLDKQMLLAWSMVISSGAMPSGAMAAPLQPLVRWARTHFPGVDFPEEVEGFRKAFMHRLAHTPGVVATREGGINTSLTYCNVPVPDYEQHPQWPELKRLIDQVGPPLRLTPNGDEIAHKIHAFKWLYELCQGFYNNLVWPSPEELAERRSVSKGQAEDALGQGRFHLEKRKKYYSVLRDWFDEGDHLGDRGQYLDTPMMVAEQMARTGPRHLGCNGDLLYTAWMVMKAAETATMATRDKRPVRVCDFKIQHCLKWAQELPKRDPGAIIWVHHQELGQWAYEIFKEALGPDRVVHCPAGDANKAALRDPANAHKLCISSLPSHYHTLNLQHHGNMYFLQMSRSATQMEQGVGRIHRQKQPRDHINVFFNNTLPGDMAVFSACIVDALYQHQTGGGRQKLIYGEWSPPQDAMPIEAVRAMGAEPKDLDKEHRKLFAAKFSKGK
jgi:hypothetical protein